MRYSLARLRNQMNIGRRDIPYALAIGALAGVIIPLTGIARAAGDPQQGAKLFAANCARCHGKTAKGDGPDLVKLQAAVSPDDWTDKESNQEMPDKFIVSMITRGGAANGKSRIMPAFGDKLKPDQIDDLLAFIRTLPK